VADRKPLPCIVCGFQPKPVGGDGHQPVSALMFDAGAGHYGSTVWDTMSRYRSLAVNVCDKCLIERKDRVGVFETVPVPDEVKLVPWKVDDDV
jgi:hypothetical protein